MQQSQLHVSVLRLSVRAGTVLSGTPQSGSGCSFGGPSAFHLCNSLAGFVQGQGHRRLLPDCGLGPDAGFWLVAGWGTRSLMQESEQEHSCPGCCVGQHAGLGWLVGGIEAGDAGLAESVAIAGGSLLHLFVPWGAGVSCCGALLCTPSQLLLLGPDASISTQQGEACMCLGSLPGFAASTLHAALQVHTRSAVLFPTACCAGVCGGKLLPVLSFGVCISCLVPCVHRHVRWCARCAAA
jgi:hypothetical protein